MFLAFKEHMPKVSQVTAPLIAALRTDIALEPHEADLTEIYAMTRDAGTDAMDAVINTLEGEIASAKQELAAIYRDDDEA
ncbi:hypothetical protein [Cupriavidus sp. 8B]